MTSFDPVPSSLYEIAPRSRDDREPRREVRRYLRLLNQFSLSQSHDRPYSWGLTVFRTVYTPESDETFPRAIERLKQRAHYFATADLSVRRLPNEEPLDPAPNEELARRFYCDVVEDAAGLDGASVDQVGERFKAWVGEHTGPGFQNQHLRGSGRFEFCIMLDQQGIDHLLQICEGRPPKGELRKHYDFYVKVVSIWRRREIQLPEMMGSHDPESYYWLRVGLFDIVFGLCFGDDTDIHLTELGSLDETDGVQNYYGLFPNGR